MLPGKTIIALSCALPLAFACQQGHDNLEVGHSNQEILGGQPISPGQFPTVVAIAVDGGQRGLCTGTLVGPDLILTAAHCINPGLAGYATQQQVTDNTVVITDSSVLGQNGTVRAVTLTVGDPAFGAPKDPDVGLVRLAQPITDREHSKVNFDRSKAPVGITVNMVGYGIADDGQAGRGFFLNNRTSTQCSADTDNELFLCFSQIDGAGKCSGDSGGPSFAMIDGVEKVVGITSFGDRDCEILGADMRTDATRSFIGANAPELLCGSDAYCEPTCGGGGALPEDPDCADPGSPGGLGAPCGPSLEACTSGLCAVRDGDQVCTQLCTPGAASACPSGFECVETSNGQGACFDETGGGICSVGGQGKGPAAIIILIALFAFTRRRRR